MADPPTELATSLLQNTVGIMIGAAGVMISFVWGFVALHPSDSTAFVKWASGLLLITIIAGLLSLQFAISAISAEGGPTNPTKKRTVAISFGIAWIAFIIGSGLLAAAIPGGI